MMRGLRKHGCESWTSTSRENRQNIRIKYKTWSYERKKKKKKKKIKRANDTGILSEG